MEGALRWAVSLCATAIFASDSTRLGEIQELVINDSSWRLASLCARQQQGLPVHARRFSTRHEDVNRWLSIVMVFKIDTFHECLQFRLPTLLPWRSEALCKGGERQAVGMREIAGLTHTGLCYKNVFLRWWIRRRPSCITLITPARRRFVAAALTSPAAHVPQRCVHLTSDKSSSPAPRFSFPSAERRRSSLDVCLSW